MKTKGVMVLQNGLLTLLIPNLSSYWSSFLSPGIFQWLERFRLKRVKARCTVPIPLRSSQFGNLLETWVRTPLKPENKTVEKPYIRQGPLNKWKEHSNCQVHSRGDSKTLIALLIPNIFLIFFMKLFFYAYKS